ESALVAGLSDNGGLRAYGGCCFPCRGGIGPGFGGGVRVPAAARWPGRIPGGVLSRELGSSVDVFPTRSRLAGADVAGLPLDGVDLGAALFEKRELPRDLFWLMDDGSGALRRGADKYVR